MSIDEFITSALKEDIGDGDHTSLACIPETTIGKAQLLIKEEGILAGVELAQNIFHKVDPDLKIQIFLKDGARVKNGDVAFTIEGSARSILKAERFVLNCMQRMSGIATITYEMVQLLKGTKTKILDTRKTTPGFRMIEKWAVKIGGGENHRFGLFDMIIIKDNHVDYAGGIKCAIESTHSYLKQNHKDLKIEIEARNLEEVKEILSVGGVDRIMLDNFSLENTREAVMLINGNGPSPDPFPKGRGEPVRWSSSSPLEKGVRGYIEIESSGGITAENVRAYAEIGVDYISVGALTHSAGSLDLSLKAIR